MKIAAYYQIINQGGSNSMNRFFSAPIQKTDIEGPHRHLNYKIHIVKLPEIRL